MTQNQKPTKKSRQVDLRHFAVTDWVSQDLLLIKKIITYDNSSGTLTKSSGQTLFHPHTDTIMGNRHPTIIFLNSYYFLCDHNSYVTIMIKDGCYSMNIEICRWLMDI